MEIVATQHIGMKTKVRKRPRVTNVPVHLHVRPGNALHCLLLCARMLICCRAIPKVRSAYAAHYYFKRARSGPRLSHLASSIHTSPCNSKLPLNAHASASTAHERSLPWNPSRSPSTLSRTKYLLSSTLIGSQLINGTEQSGNVEVVCAVVVVVVVVIVLILSDIERNQKLRKYILFPTESRSGVDLPPLYTWK